VVYQVRHVMDDHLGDCNGWPPGRKTELFKIIFIL